MAATIRDITRMTGLSLATVSKYLNGGNVLPQNRILIEDAIEKLHYEVNEVARGLATNRTRTVGILTHRLDNLFAGTIITEIEDILRKMITARLCAAAGRGENRKRGGPLSGEQAGGRYHCDSHVIRLRLSGS